MSDRLTRIVENYELKLRLGSAGRLTEDEISARVGRYGIAAAREDAVLNEVRQILCCAGIVPMMFPPYHAFSRELGKLSRQEISVETLECETAIAVAKWVARGLEQCVLRAIATNVFNIGLPTPPTSEEAAQAGR